MHNTPEQNADFRKAWDATNARYRAAVKADKLAAEQRQCPKCPHSKGFNCRICYPSQYANK